MKRDNKISVRMSDSQLEAYKDLCDNVNLSYSETFRDILLQWLRENINSKLDDCSTEESIYRELKEKMPNSKDLIETQKQKYKGLEREYNYCLNAYKEFNVDANK